MGSCGSTRASPIAPARSSSCITPACSNSRCSLARLGRAGMPGAISRVVRPGRRQDLPVGVEQLARAAMTAATELPVPGAPPAGEGEPRGRDCRVLSGVSLATAMRRARKDPIARLLAAATAAGVRFRISGATLQVAGADALHPDDRALAPAVPPGHPPAPRAAGARASTCSRLLDVDVEVITDAARAREVIAALGPGALGFDIETMPIAANGAGRPWIRITKDGRRAVHQPADKDNAGLDPFRARPRLAQIYDHATRPSTSSTCARADRGAPAARAPAADHPQRGFELAMLGACGIHLRSTFCTLLLARLALGAERGGLRLAEVAAEFLDGSSCPRTSRLATGRPSACPRSSSTTPRSTRWSRSGSRSRSGPTSTPARARLPDRQRHDPGGRRMRLAGIPFDRADPRGDDRRLGARLRRGARRSSSRSPGPEIPPAGAQRSAWLEERMPADMLGWWPRTETGLLRTRSADLERLAAVPEIRPLLDVIHWDKRLRAFGRTLLEKIGADGRLRMDLKPAWTKTGRCACSRSQSPAAAAGRAPGRRRAARARAYYRRLQSDRAPGRGRAVRRRGDARRCSATAATCTAERRGRSSAPASRPCPRTSAEIAAQQGQAHRLRHALRHRPARARGVGLVHVPHRDDRGRGAGLQGAASTPATRSCGSGRTRPPTRPARPACCARSPAGRSAAEWEAVQRAAGRCAATTRSRAPPPT